MLFLERRDTRDLILTSNSPRGSRVNADIESLTDSRPAFTFPCEGMMIRPLHIPLLDGSQSMLHII